MLHKLDRSVVGVVVVVVVVVVVGVVVVGVVVVVVVVGVVVVGVVVVGVVVVGGMVVGEMMVGVVVVRWINGGDGDLMEDDEYLWWLGREEGGLGWIGGHERGCDVWVVEVPLTKSKQILW